MNLTTGIFDPADISDLSQLIGSGCFEAPIQIHKAEADSAITMLSDMLCIRLTEEAIGTLIDQGHIKCPCHLGIGQEAIAVGVSQLLNASDKIFGAHRSHSHFLALGASIKSLIAEVLGKDTGCSKGMGGSMHLRSPEHGFYGSVPIVGATIPIAVGAGLAAKFDRKKAIAVSYLGDGACEEGVFHESLNLAAAHKIPVLFVVENNLYSSHMDILLRQPNDMVSRFALAHKIPALVVDGNNSMAIKYATKELTELIRNAGGPAFIEAITYRWRGHVGPDENIDVGLRRNAEDIAAWKKRDPILRLYNGLINAGLFSESKYQDLQEKIANEIAVAVEEGLAAPYPELSALIDRVWKS